MLLFALTYKVCVCVCVCVCVSVCAFERERERNQNIYSPAFLPHPPHGLPKTRSRR
ncbi:MAG TPA: hypothetical protein V6C97_03585 [Oculatellaceae cyanobacterium]